MTFDQPQGLIAAARQLGEDGVLGPDPTDDTILLAAAELCDWVGDLSRITPYQRRRVIREWERADEERP